MARPFANDQAAHNVLVHSGSIPHVRVVTSERQGVITLGYVPVSRLRTNAESELINSNEDVYHVVHQYDRLVESGRFQLTREGGAFRLGENHPGLA